MERITGCGGNCCPSRYFFVSYRGNGRFETSDDLADSWVEPVIEKWKGQWSVVLVSNNEGYNTDKPLEITRRFFLQGGKAVKVEESRRKDLVSPLALRSDLPGCE